MDSKLLRTELQQALWQVVDSHPWVLSATLTGSFWERPSLENASDIDVVVVADDLDEPRYQALLSAAQDAVQPVLAKVGYKLIVNPTLGPLKLNAPQAAVLHLMLYSRQAHIDHAIASPFTCFDWQRSQRTRRHTLADVFPVLALQPQHFISGRRGLGDYLRDFRAREVSYRRLEFSGESCREVRCMKPMSERDAHEFAYHVMRFLMHNLVKLVQRANKALEINQLLAEYLAIFPEHSAETESLFRTLAAKKHAQDFAVAIENLDARLEDFVRGFEAQFRLLFFDRATRHIMFRHAPTHLNHALASNRIFLGRSDPAIEAVETHSLSSLVRAVEANSPRFAYSSPLLRCRQSIARLAEPVELPVPELDQRLLEMDYGAAEGLTVTSARAHFTEFFDRLSRGVDPRFPGGGENTRSVHARASQFALERFSQAGGNTITCTHNVVLRCLVGEALGLQQADWHRLQIPHLEPFVFVQTRAHGLFLDLPQHSMRHIFHNFTLEPREHTCRS